MNGIIHLQSELEARAGIARGHPIVFFDVGTAFAREIEGEPAITLVRRGRSLLGPLGVAGMSPIERISGAMNNSPQKRPFEVEVTRHGFAFRTVSVEAETMDEAVAKALDEAGNHEYSEKHSEYFVDGFPPEGREPPFTATSRPTLPAQEHWSSPNGCHPDCPACEETRSLMRKKTLGEIVVTPCADPSTPGEPDVRGFGGTNHIGVNFTDPGGQSQRGWIPLALWSQMLDASPEEEECVSIDHPRSTCAPGSLS